MAKPDAIPAADGLPWRHATGDHAARIYVIAEIGVNHDGDPRKAEQLVHAAAEAKADAVKVQVFRADTLMSSASELAAYQSKQGETDPREMLRRLELTDEQLADVRDAARQRGIGFIATPFSLSDIPRLDFLGIDAVKIASPDAVNTPLLEAAGTLNRPLIISTGACECDELFDAAACVHRHGGALLHCVSAYPTPVEQAGLGGIAALRERLAVPAGYSDHTTETRTGAWAVMTGACVLEKHLTLDRAAKGPDHAASLEPTALCNYIKQAHAAAAALGPVAKTVTPIEREVRQLSRQSVCVTRDLPAGHRLTRDDLTVKRPGTGVPARAFERVVGQTLTQDIAADQPLTDAHLAPGDTKPYDP